MFVLLTVRRKVREAKNQANTTEEETKIDLEERSCEARNQMTTEEGGLGIKYRIRALKIF